MPPSESRLELDENDDSPRFYGPTSQRYIQRRSFAAVDEGSNMPDTSTEELKMDSAPLRSLLFHNWWQIQPNSVVVVDEAWFQSSRHVGGRSEYYSTFLENSLLACATRISTSESVRALGPKYAERAKTETAQELEYPISLLCKASCCSVTSKLHGAATGWDICTAVSKCSF